MTAQSGVKSHRERAKPLAKPGSAR